MSFGSSWIEDNKTVSYAYISGLTLGEAKKFDQFKKKKQKLVMLETEAKAKGLAFGKPYKFSLKAASYAFNFGSECEYLYYLSEHGLSDKISYNHQTSKLESPLQGKMVVTAYLAANLYHDIENELADSNEESEDMMELATELRIHIDAYPEAFKSAKQKGLIS